MSKLDTKYKKLLEKNIEIKNDISALTYESCVFFNGKGCYHVLNWKDIEPYKIVSKEHWSYYDNWRTYHIDCDIHSKRKKCCGECPCSVELSISDFESILKMHNITTAEHTQKQRKMLNK